MARRVFDQSPGRDLRDGCRSVLEEFSCWWRPAAALRAEASIWLTWRKNFLWTSITYFAGASAAALIARFIGNVGFFAFVSTIPIIAIVYFTYWTYMKNVASAAAQAEQARQHVEELNRHIAEQERISKALRETEEHFRNAFDYAAIGMALVSPQGALAPRQPIACAS